MNVVITGATGFIGRRLISRLAVEHQLSTFGRQDPTAESLAKSDAIVHLAGEPVAQRWTAEAKAKIRESRVLGTRRLVEALAKQSRRPTVFICGSAIGIYGSRGDEILTEPSALGNDFLAGVCREWENEASKAEALGIRVVKIRTGIVLGPGGGALQKMLPPFRAFVGGKLGSGKQWMSWIHIDDLTGIIEHALNNPMSGAVNGTAPEPVTNSAFTNALAHALKRPAIFPVPEFALKTLFGEMSAIMLDSQRVLPKAAEAEGYRFRFPELGPALQDVLTRTG